MSVLLRLAILACALAALFPVGAAARPSKQCFTETRQCVDGRFEEFWKGNGGLPVFGFAITSQSIELNRDTNQRFTTQWLERNRFELHPENPAPYDVLLGRLGDDRLRQLGRDWQKEPREAGAKAGCLWFEQTGHNVCNQAGAIGFRAYWESHGLEFDGQAGTAYAESLALFGLPLTEPKTELNTSGDRVVTQWFERARFEYHPEKQQAEFKVLLGLLGNEVRFKWAAPR